MKQEVREGLWGRRERGGRQTFSLYFIGDLGKESTDEWPEEPPLPYSFPTEATLGHPHPWG